MLLINFSLIIYIIEIEDNNEEHMICTSPASAKDRNIRNSYELLVVILSQWLNIPSN